MPSPKQMQYPNHPFRGFTSDNSAGIQPQILQAIIDANVDHVYAYGHDHYSDEAVAEFKHHFGDNIDVHFVTTGTAANVLAIAALVQHHEAVLCATDAHLNNRECAATERFVGCKVLAIPCPHGKLTVPLLQTQMVGFGDDHFSQPKMVAITQANEHGLLYTVDEIRDIVEFAHANHLYVYIDGARYANACASLNISLKAMSADLGVDALNLGGTKNGLLYGEALIFFNPELGKQFRYIRKQAMQTVSKMRFVAAQFTCYLREQIWLKNAQHANQMARYFANELAKVSKVDITQEVDINIIFARLPKSVIAPLQSSYPFHVADANTGLVRLVTSFDTRLEEIDGFIITLKDLLNK